MSLAPYSHLVRFGILSMTLCPLLSVLHVSATPTIFCVPRNCGDPGWEVDVTFWGWTQNTNAVVLYFLDGELVKTVSGAYQSGKHTITIPAETELGLHTIRREVPGFYIPKISSQCREIDFRVADADLHWGDDDHNGPWITTFPPHNAQSFAAKFNALDCNLPECKKVVFVQLVRQQVRNKAGYLRPLTAEELTENSYYQQTLEYDMIDFRSKCCIRQLPS